MGKSTIKTLETAKVFIVNNVKIRKHLSDKRLYILFFNYFLSKIGKNIFFIEQLTAFIPFLNQNFQEFHHLLPKETTFNTSSYFNYLFISKAFIKRSFLFSLIINSII